MSCTLSPFSLNALQTDLNLHINRLPSLTSHAATRIYARRLPDSVRYPRRTQLPPHPGVNIFLKKTDNSSAPSSTDCSQIDKEDLSSDDWDQDEEGNHIEWDSDEIDAISSLFQGRIPQKPGKLSKERPLPLPLPYKLRPQGLPTPKKHIKIAAPKVVTSRAFISKQLYKNPEFLIGLARDVRALTSEEDVSEVLKKYSPFLRKGSLSLTIRELGRMGQPERALEVFSWAQKQPHLFPDDRILASTVEVLARNHRLKVPFNLENFITLANRGVVEAMVRGFIKGGSLNLAWKLLSAAKNSKRMLGPSIYAKLILELGKNPDKDMLVLALLDDLGEREHLDLTQQDCTAIMKICVRLRRFDIVEGLFDWCKETSLDIGIVMYTTMIHSRYSEQKYREAVALVWEMEALDFLFDLPAYRVIIKLFVALNDLPRAERYHSKLKEAGFSPTYDIYRDLIKLFLNAGRLAKCKEICGEAEIAGLRFG